jgi:hypothetical protein
MGPMGKPAAIDRSECQELERLLGG